MSKYLPYILLFLMAILSYFLWQSSREVKRLRAEVNSRIQDEIQAKQAVIDTAAGLIQKIRVKVGKDSLENSRVVSGLKLRISTLRSKLSEMGEITPEEVEDTTCARLIYVSSLKDSVIDKQDDLISELELRHSATLIDLEAIIRAQSDQIVAHVAISDAWRLTAEKAQQNETKERRKGRLKSVVIGVLTAGIVYVSLRE